jgi:hypothetical protein
MSNYSARRINALLEAMQGPSRYLEVGVETGFTFFEVSAAAKTAVDPNFMFDLEEAKEVEPTSQFFPTTSDAYFRNHWNGQMFDLIFLDGLHTWDQTYRDFCNALLATHEHSVILLDDIFPNDVFSCNRDQLEGTMMRQLMLNSPVNAWHGDTYKIMPLIQTFHPSLNYCTIIGDDNPQALVWRSTTSMECGFDIIQDQGSMTMASLDYLWFLRNQNNFNLMEESEAIAMVVAALR